MAMTEYRWYGVPDHELDRVWVAHQEVRMHIEPITHGMPGICTDCPPGDDLVCLRFRRAIRTLIDHGLSPYTYSNSNL